MPSFIASSQPATPREMLMWAVMGTLVAGLLAAFWALCDQQVRKAQLRDAAAQGQRVAVSDCLGSMPRSTFRSCAEAANTVSVNFTFR